MNYYDVDDELFQSDVERHTLAKYLMELTLLDYHMVHYRPSEIAAASLCLSQLLLEGLPWVSLGPERSTFKCISAAAAKLGPLSLRRSSTTPPTTRPTSSPS